jgi:hypothetical protein
LVSSDNIEGNEILAVCLSSNVYFGTLELTQCRYCGCDFEVCISFCFQMVPLGVCYPSCLEISKCSEDCGECSGFRIKVCKWPSKYPVEKLNVSEVGTFQCNENRHMSLNSGSSAQFPGLKAGCQKEFPVTKPSPQITTSKQSINRHLRASQRREKHVSPARGQIR